MRIPIDRSNDIPLYQQIENWLRENILSGKLLPETRLPATRALADKLGVSRITVKNAYANLESDGLILTRMGSGTYVAPLPAAPAAWQNEAGRNWPLWQMEAAGDSAPPEDFPRPRSRHLSPISFTGVGDPRQFPIKDFAKTMQEVLRQDGVAALEYGRFDGGYPPLRATITHVLASQGIQAHPERVLVTSGSQQALALVCSLLLRPGDVIFVENPTYNLALELFRELRLKIIGVPLDENGMRVDLLEPLLQKHHPRLIYTIPNFQNPSGACLSGARRRQLLALADRYNVPILEDDFVGDLRYEGRAQPAIKAIDPGGRVIYVGTFSKMLMPGLRVGYMLADGPIFERLVHIKRVNDLTTSTLIQRTLDVYVTVGRYQAHLRRSARLYRQRRDAMLAAIRCFLPANASVSPPQGGLFIWLKLPEEISALELLPLGLEAGAEFAPGTRFFVTPAEGERYLRLNFATCTLQEIEIGIQRLGTAMGRLSTTAH
ncbi:MAG: PLP-dependent aminotransferase family protein [Chloroflexota bacterium]